MLLTFPQENEVAYHFPDADHFEKWWTKAETDSEQEYHVMANLRSVYDWIEAAELFDANPEDNIRTLIENTGFICPPLQAAEALCQWECNRDQPNAYKEALAGRHLFDLSYTIAQQNDWNSVARLILERSIGLSNSLGVDYTVELERVIAVLSGYRGEEDIPLETFTALLDLIVDHARADDHKAIIQQALVCCIERANILRSRKQYAQERSVLKTAIELAREIEAATDGLESRYAKTFWLNAQLQGQRDTSLQGSELLEGLDDEIVLEVLSQSEKEEWKDEIRDAVQSAATELRRTGVALGDDDLNNTMEALITQFTQQFRHIALVHDRVAALYWLLSNPRFLTSVDLDMSAETPALEIFPVVGLSSTGHLIQFDPEEEDISHQYVIDMSIRPPMFMSVVSRLMDERLITEGTIYRLLHRLDSVSPENLWYFTEVITNVFDEQYTAAVHLGATRLEPLLYQLLRHEGEDVDALMDDGSGTRTLGSLLGVSADYLSEDLQTYLEYMYNEHVGQIMGGNLRNRIAHGLLFPAENNRYLALLILTDLLRTALQFDATPFRAEYGIPAILELPNFPIDLVINRPAGPTSEP